MVETPTSTGNLHLYGSPSFPESGDFVVLEGLCDCTNGCAVARGYDEIVNISSKINKIFRLIR